MRRRALDALLYFPSRALTRTPAAAGLAFEDLALDAEDGVRLHGWWIPAPGPRAGHLLYCHGNGGNVADRVAHAALLARLGFDVLLFDYRGYGRSAGAPGEAGTYRDARAARRALLARPGVDAGAVVYLGESLGGAIALALALEHPPAGLILQSTFTSVRDMARLHYPFIPTPVVPDAYPSLRRIPALRAPLLVLHGDRDELVPADHGRALFAAAPEPKRLRVFPGAGHDVLATIPAAAYGEAIGTWR
jgi:uncharacterized protein